jgi:hypothetical protein
MMFCSVCSCQLQTILRLVISAVTTRVAVNASVIRRSRTAAYVVAVSKVTRPQAHTIICNTGIHEHHGHYRTLT